MSQPANRPTDKPARKSLRKRLVLAFLAIFLLPVLLGAGRLAYRGGPGHWSDWDRTVTSQMPPAAEHPRIHPA